MTILSCIEGVQSQSRTIDWAMFGHVTMLTGAVHLD